MPVFEDWEAAAALLQEFRAARPDLPDRMHFVLVDDGSLSQPTRSLGAALGEGWSLEILRLARNLGHQRAIAVALCHSYEHFQAKGIIVMDSDGEDPPGAIGDLLRHSYHAANDRVVFASRMRRSEGPVFAFFYHSYRLLHRLLTGVNVRVGNFSYLPWRFLHRLVVSSELWNNYSATIFVSRVPYVLVPVARAERLRGTSKMSFPSLVSHGLGAISVFSIIVGTRMLIVLGALVLLSVLLLLGVVVIRAGTALAVPGWATYSAGLLLVQMTLLMSLAGAFAFLVLSGRSSAQTVPLRDYRVFLRGSDVSNHSQ